MIQLKKVGKSFDNGVTYSVRDLSLSIAEGETLILLGYSGCGKTTTLRMINRLIECTTGQIIVDDKDVKDFSLPQLRRSIGYVFQGIGLFPLLSVRQNVEIVPKLLKWRPDERRARADSLLTMMGLPPDEYGHRYPHELSGGQQQRVGVARALAADPMYLLMDEPFGALDPVTRDTLQQELIHLKERLDKTIVFVTHDIVEAFLLGDRIAVMHEGRVEQVGTGEELLREPATRVVEELIHRPARKLASFAKAL